MPGIYHAGELAVQALAGVQEMAPPAERVIKTTMKPVVQEFLHQQPMAIVGSVDAEARVWASIVAGPPAFMMAVNEGTIHIGVAPPAGDPLRDNLRVNADVGLLIIDFATRRRMRVNGSADPQPDGSFYVHAQQVYGNCPKYIQGRRYKVRTPVEDETPNAYLADKPTERQLQWITQADTFFIASAHPDGGVDASHRGGIPAS